MPEISTGLSSTNHEVDTISKQSLSTSALISSPWYLGGHEMLKHSFLHFLVRSSTQKVVRKFQQEVQFGFILKVIHHMNSLCSELIAG